MDTVVEREREKRKCTFTLATEDIVERVNDEQRVRLGSVNVWTGSEVAFAGVSDSVGDERLISSVQERIRGMMRTATGCLPRMLFL